MVERDLSASLEDYLEAILALARESTVARSKDIAAALGVAKSSVTGALRLLAGRGMVNYRPYGVVTLTAEGEAAAAAVARKHEVIHSFFEDVLGIERALAQQTACEVEHSLGPEVMGKLVQFLEFIRGEENVGEKFRQHCNGS
jgi:DtxR family Mn-dependent transcriptional regulator